MNETMNETMNTLNFTFNFNAPVGQNIAHVDKLEAHFDKDMTMQVVDGEALAPTLDPSPLTALPEVLLTSKAQELHARLMEAGMVDAAWMPVGLSGAERGVLAFQLAVRLDVQNPWQVIAPLWGTTPGALRSAYNRANEQRKTLSFIEKLKNILG